MEFKDKKINSEEIKEKELKELKKIRLQDEKDQQKEWRRLSEHAHKGLSIRGEKVDYDNISFLFAKEMLDLYGSRGLHGVAKTFVYIARFDHQEAKKCILHDMGRNMYQQSLAWDIAQMEHFYTPLFKYLMEIRKKRE